jgi:CubicO group peptidase (beta-lactamase class C family)
MKNIKITLRIILTFTIVIIFTSCHAFRGLRWWYADLDDVNKFPSVELKKSAEPFEFTKTFEVEPNNACRLDTLLRNTNTVAFIVIRNDSVLYENYWDDYQPNSKIPSFSVAKSFVSTLVGIAIDEGFIKNTSEPITSYIPEWLEKGELYQKITIQDCLDMASGLDNGENYGGVNMFTPMVRMYYGTNLEKEIFNAEIGFPRGAFNYQSINTQVLAMVVERATGKKIQDYIVEKIWQPLGMKYDASWSVDSKKRETVKAFAALNAAPIDFAKLGRLFLNQGNWNGTQVISKDWVQTTTDFENLYQNGYKNQWWASVVTKIFTDSLKAVEYKNANLQTTKMSSKGNIHWLQDYGKAYRAEGILNQFIFVRPDKNLIIVRMGDYPESRIRVSNYESYWMNNLLGYVSELY